MSHLGSISARTLLTNVLRTCIWGCWPCARRCEGSVSPEIHCWACWDHSKRGNSPCQSVDLGPLESARTEKSPHPISGFAYLKCRQRSKIHDFVLIHIFGCLGWASKTLKSLWHHHLPYQGAVRCHLSRHSKGRLSVQGKLPISSKICSSPASSGSNHRQYLVRLRFVQEIEKSAC